VRRKLFKEMRGMERIISEQQFQEIISGEELTVIKFFADWCPDCKRMDMFINPIITEHSDKQWYEIDKNEFQTLTEKYEVMGIPSLLVFKNGGKIAHLHSANAKSPEEVEDFLKSLS
jgi:thioredoxin 1